MLFEVVECGAHLRDEVRQQIRVLGQLELIFVCEKRLELLNVECIDFGLDILLLSFLTAIVARANGLQAVEDELLIELRQ